MMFDFADTDGDGQLSFGEFLKVINPPKPDKEGTVEGKVVKKEDEASFGTENCEDDDNRVGGEVQTEEKDDVKVVKFEDEISIPNNDENIKTETKKQDI